MPLLFSLPLSLPRFSFDGVNRWRACRWRARLVPLLLLAFAAAAPDAAAQQGQLPVVSVNSPSVTEGNSGTTTMTFTLTLDKTSAEGKETVRYLDSGTGTATAGTDYVALTTTDTTFDGVDYAAVNFGVGEDTKTISVTVNGDTVGEADETIVLTLSDPDDTVALAATSATGTITNDDGSTLSINSPSVAEGDSGRANLTYNVSLTPASAQQVTVGYSDAGTGTATSGTDYTAISSGTLTFPAGTTLQTFDVSVTGDTLDEADETVIATLSNAQNAAIATASGTGTITDDDDPPTVSVAAASVTEGDSGSTNLTFTATLSAASGKQVTVAWAEGTGGTATSGTDYTAITGGTLTFAAGTTTQTFNVSVTGDVVDESNETVVVTLSSPTNATISATAGSATGTITDNDATPTSITLTVNDDSVDEGDGDTTITVTATVDGTTRFGVDKTVTVSVAGSGTAGAVDFAAVSDFDITIAAGAASKSETFTLSPTDDSVDETDETITVSGTSTGLTINPDTITLSDDDDTPSITLTVDDSSVAEDDGATTITVTATVDDTTRFVDDTTVAVSVAGSGTAAAVDFASVSSFNISIGAGAASGTATFTLTPTNDTVHEANETITVSGTSGALTVNSATITLTDDEALPTVALSLSSTSIGEAGGASTVTATLSAVSSAAVTLTVGAAAGTGAVAADFSLSTAKTLTIAAGATASTGTVTVTAADNDVDAANKSVTVSATVTGGNGVAAPSSVTLTLTDDDTAGITFSPATLTLTEQGASQKFTMVLDSEPTGLVYIRFHPDPGISVKGAEAPDTYYWGSLDSSNWDTGITERELTVAALADSNMQDETRYVKYSMSGYGSFDAPFSNPKNAVKVTVEDDDKPTVSLSLSSSSISENGGVATVTATLDEAASVATTVTVSSAAGTDTDASDFTLSSANTLTIAAGDTTSAGTVTITAVNNTLDEPNKSVTVSGTVSHNGVTRPTAKTLTITDDDPAPMLSIDSPSVTEGDSGSKNLTFTATLSAASGKQVTVDYADAGTGTATSGTDYTAITAGTLTFAAGTTSQTFNVAVTGDVLDEADETVKVRLKDPVNAAVSTTAGTGTGTITDNDATPTLSISSPSVAEGDSGSTSLTYTVTLSAASGRQVTVQYADAGTGTATSGTDYTAITAGALTFAAGTTSQTFSVLVTGDTVNESNETILVSLSAPTNAVVSTTAGTGTGTITDADGAPTSITLTVDDDDVGEGDGGTTITVTATVDGTTRFAEAKTVTVSVAGSGTATAVDFAAVSNFNISIAAGAASGTGTFTLTPTDDSDDETDETITVSGTSTGLTVNPVTISLTDDDGTPTSITLTVDDSSVSEGDGATTITVTATLNGSDRFVDATAVTMSVAGSGAAGAVDFSPVLAFDMQSFNFMEIPGGAASGTGTFTLTPTNDDVDETDETITVSGTAPGLTVNSATISLTDNDAAPTAITLTVSDSSVGEGDEATSITVTATVDGTTRFAEAKTVRVSVAGSGTAGAVDFAAVEAFNIEIAAEAASGTGTFTLTPTDDAVDETNETVTVRGTSSGLTVNAATITLTDDDGAPTSITLTVDDNSVGEGDGAATITVTATVDGTMRFAEATTVTVSVAGSGTATAVDFAAVSSFGITIPAGAASKTGSFTLTPTNDAVDETDETVTVSGTSGSLTVNSATIALTDNDAAPTSITLTVSDDSVSEGDGATTITVTATVDGTTRFAAATTVTVLVTGGGTPGGVNFSAGLDFDITIAAGAASGASDFTLTPTDDALDGVNETVTFAGFSGSLTVNDATITLTDDDATPTAITLTVDDNSVAEDDGATTITVTATVDGGTRFITDTTVTVSVAGSGTATAVDFAAVSDFDITIAAADASGTETFTLTPTDDAFDETNETITVSGTSGTLTVSSATITLTDDDDAPTAITLTVDDNSVAEDDGATTITVTATVDGTSRFTEATTVTVSVAGSGTASAVDFAAVSSFDIEIAAGEASKSETFTLTPTDDVVDETNETVTVSGSSGSLTVNSATITLTDDDAAPTEINLTVDDTSVAEDDGATTITVTATVDGTTRFVDATTVTVSVAGSGTATAVDFAAVTDFDITIAAEAQSKTGTFTLTPTDDVVDETNETVTVSGESGSLTVNSATISLTDDDAAPTAITLTVNDNSVAEDDGATTITVTATVDGTTRFATATTVTVSVGGSGTATAVDFAAVSDFDITIAADAASGASDFTLTPTNDAVDETNETVTVSGESGSLTVNSATITLTDDDDAPTAITLTVNDNSVGEGDGATTIMVTATVDGGTRFAAATTVSVSVAGSGTATAVDFAAVSDFDIEIAAGAASKTGTFTLTPTNDVVDETNETITVSGTSGSLTVSSATIALTDDDAAPTAITLTVNDNSVAEDDGATTITVTATVDGMTRFVDATTVTVSVAGSGTATAVDFGAVTDFDITIAAGAASKSETFTLTPTDDVVDETNETVTVSGESGSLTVNSATITLTDDDAAPTAITLTVNDNSVAEDDGATTITVTATVDGTTRFAAATTVTVSVAGSGTASAVDFAAVTDFDITIAAEAQSKTGTFTLTPTDDVVDETNETVTVSGESGSLTVNSATISLTDDDAAPTAITLTVNDNSVAEDDGATTITVTATVDGTTRFATATTVTVSVGGSGTATAVDFAAVSDFDITIAADAASGASDFTLTPTNDAVDETNETVTVSGESGSLTVNSATITLTDDDAAPTSITLTVDDDGVGEDDGATLITVTATVDGTTRFAEATTVRVSVAGSGTATAVDFAAVSDFDITIAAEAASKTGSFTLTPTDDSVDETDETITVSGASGTLTVNSATINLTDDDGMPTSITLTVNDNSVAEGDGATTITVKATVNGTTQFATAKTVRVSVAGSGTATAVDFAAVTDFDIEIAAGAMSADETFTLTPTNDVVDETNETITVRGTSSGLIVNSATITLTDDDAAPTAITLTVNDNSVGEGDGATAITVTATVDGTTRFAAATTVTVSVAGSGTATAVDFAAVSDFDITIAAEAASEDETFTLTPTNDVVDETNETVTVSGASGSLTVNSATITLTDDDAAPTSITLTVNDDSVSEDDRATTITVTATVDGTTRFAAATTVTVSVAGTAPSTAVDFAAVDAFDIEIDAGAASGASDFTLMPTDNVLYNTDETITVSGTSGSLTVNAATITLADDEGPATLSINSPRVTEGSSGSKDLTFTVTLNPISIQPVTVDYADAGSGTATPGTDYVAISGGSLTFPARTALQEITVSVRGDTVVEPDETVVVSLSSPVNAPIGTGTGTGTIANDDVSDPPPVDDAPSLSIDSPSVAEGDDDMVSLTFTVTLSPASSAQVTVDYVVTGTAASGTDYAAITGGTLTFPPGTTSRTITVSVMGDVLNEGDETIVVTLSNVRNAAIDTATGTGTITDDDSGPKLSIDSPRVAEGNSGSTTLTFTVTLSEALTEQVTVDYADAGTGTATPGTDYAAIPAGALTFAAGTTSQTFNVSVTGDVLDEADETVAVTLSNAVNAAIGAATGTGAITDDDAPPSLSIDSPRVAEGDSGSTTLTFTVTLSAASGRAVTVDYADAGTGTATSGTDYAALAGGTLTFPAGTTSQTFDVSVTGDAAAEPDETVVVTLSNAGNATIGTATGTGAITDDDSGPSLSIDSPRVLEGDRGSTTLTFTVTLSETHTEAVTVDYADAGTGTATPGTDYTALTGGALTFPAGATSQTFDVLVTGDVLDEADETIVVTLSNAGNAAIATMTGTGAITDDDESPSLSIDSPSVPEGDAGSVNLTWTVTLSAASGRAVTVDYADAGTGTATSGTDYAALAAGTLTFAAGATRREVTVSVMGDVLDEADETVAVTLSNAINAAIGAATGTGAITDDDAPPSLSIDSPRVAEGDSGSTTLTFTVTLSAASGRAVTVDYADAGTGTATSGTDYAALAGGTLTFPAGTTSQTFDVSVTGDAAAEPDETVVVTLSNAGNATIGTATGTGAITDDDSGPSLSIDSPRVLEGDRGSTTLTFTVTLSAAGAEAVTVDYADAGTGTATSGTDYMAITAGTLTFAAGATRREVTVSVMGDVLDEGDETVVVTLSNAGNATIGTATGTGTITDDDGAPSLSIDSPSVSEGDDGSVSLTWTVTLSAASGLAVTVDYADAGTGTATPGTDYTAITGGTLTFAAGTTSQTFNVSVMGDVLDEGDETVVVTLSNAGNATIGTATGTGTITDDDAAPSLSIDSPSVSEGDDGSVSLTWTVTLGAASGRAVTVDYADAGTGTATPGTDYAAITGGTLTFAAGTTSQTFNVSVMGDVLDEADETVVVMLSNAGNATIGTATGTGAITDDDAAPSLSIDSPSVSEGDDGSVNLTYTVTLSAASGLAVTVDYADAGTGTATPGTDYAAITGGTLTFPAGATSREVTVSVTGDVLDEADETVVVMLSNAGNATIGTAMGTGAITDDDAPPSLSIDSPSVSEGDAGSVNLTWTVTLSAASGLAVTVDYADAGTGTATPGTDYAAITGGTLTFPVGTTSQTFNVSVTGDVLDEADETVVVTLSNAGNAIIGTAMGTGAITDDDAPPSLSIDSPSVSEGDDGSMSLTYTVTLSAASGRAVAVDYADAGTGTATSGTDYAAIGTGTLTFPAGATRRQVTVSVTGDVLVEPDETVVVTLSNAGNATIGAATGTGTIVNDDIDLTPSFGSATIPAQSWIQNWVIPALTLPAATGGDGALSYALTPALPSGLSFDAATREVSGTPMKALGATEYSLTATDEDGDKATLSFEIEVAGPIALSIADAQAVEGEPVEFGITLSRPVPAAGAMLVIWRVTDGTALAHSDYALPGGRQGELTVGAGQDAATLVIQTTNDELAEGEETFTAMLVGSSHAQLGDARATGRIVDDDLASLRGEALQWSLAAFGRTVATEAVDAIGQRFRPGGSSSATRAGGSDTPARDGTGAGSGTAGAGWTAGATGAGSGTAGAGWTTGAWRNFSLDSPAGASSPGGFSGPERSPQGEFLSTVAFETNLGATDADGGSGRQWTLWGRGSRSQFSGRSGARLTLDGEVNTGYLGADVRLAEGGPLLGVALSYSDGQLDYEAAEAGLDEGRIDVDLSSVLPYGHWALNERVSFWGLLGIGWGKASLTDEFGRVTTDTEMQMAALGSRGELVTWRGLALALKGDAFVVNMEGSEWARGDAVMLPEVEADANRLRLMVEGRREWQPSAQQQLGLSLEFGGRWDGGDADTGMGTELGGGLEYRHAAWGLGLETRGRYLLGHTERAFEEWGASVALALDPGEEGIGPSLTLAPAWGEASSGVENMWREERLLGASLGDQEMLAERGGWRPNRLRMELGYGFETRAQRLLKLYSALEEDGPGSRNWRLGSQVTGGWFTWSLELDRRESWGASPEHGIFLRFGNGLTNTNPVASPLSN